MFENIEKRLQKQRDEAVSKRDKVSETPENTETTEIIAKLGQTTFEQLLRKKIREDGIVEVFESGDGTLKMHTTQIIDNWLFYSLCVLAVLFVLLLTKIMGVW